MSITNYNVLETLQNCAFLLSGHIGKTVEENLELINSKYAPNKCDAEYVALNQLREELGTHENKRKIKIDDKIYKILKNWSKLTGKSVHEIAEIMLKNGINHFDKSVEIEAIINERS